ncbi:MAG: phage tail protein [Alphaproteobacteria bacterium]|nr:phage tail protein [Alphaproteobacteria bacterium]
MLMGWGPFRFTVPNYSVEQLSHSVKSRVSSQQVIGARPPTHLLGPDEETITLQSTFHPFHLNGKGLQQLAGVQEAVRQQAPLILVDSMGRNWRRWVGTSIDSEQTEFAVNGVPQTVTVSLSLTCYVGGLSQAGGISLGGGFGFSASFSAGGFSVSLGF